jgi:hypothetical protein
MVLTNYFYEVSTTVLEDRVELLEERSGYMTAMYSKRFKDQINSIQLDGKIAVLYVGGAGIHNAETREYKGNYECSVDVQEDGAVIKKLQAYMMHRYIGMLHNSGNNVTYANVSSDTCASSMYSLYEAERLLKDKTVDHVVIIAEEKTSRDTIRIFHEHHIEVKPGECFALAVFSREGEGTTVGSCKWEYSYNRNPFLVNEEGYRKVATACDVVKGHQTGTEQNDNAEKAVFGDNIVGYKSKIGHCQGASGLIEVLLVIDDEDIAGNVLCTASGLGGFYGSCLVEK